MTAEYSGSYFRDIPVCVTAVPFEGKKLDHWEIINGAIINEDGETVTFLPDADCVIAPVYVEG